MKQKIPRITKEQARRFLLQRQLLDHTHQLTGLQGAYKVIDRLGYVQIDTINVIERSHHIVLFTRCPDYTADYLHQLQLRKKKIFEYWAHAASFIPMKDFRFYLRKMKGQHQFEGWINSWHKKHRTIVKSVRKRIEQEGALMASDFTDTRKRKRGPWWDWKPAKAALEVLFWRGELMIKERKNFQRVYDLTERLLPAHIDTTIPSEIEEDRFFVRRALDALGIATNQDINRYIWGKRKLNQVVHEMCRGGEVLSITISGLDKQYYILRKYLKKLFDRQAREKHVVSFLSPFDNTIILRDRTAALFDFSYTLECYTPPKKRTFGYFCLPILWQNDLVGRIDPKADREKGILLLRNVVIEKKPSVHHDFLHALSHALKDFAHFHKCEDIVIERATPSNYKKLLARHL